MIVKYTSDKKEEWDMYLDTSVFPYNTAKQESTLYSPFELDAQDHQKNTSFLYTACAGNQAMKEEW